ncbi:uncharacterized protein LOC119569110 [Penaeus monodon]|uniref:uncharacterized protein LOC119569110 n=1 Tax=Penaeus monodon TaxID=6687 RepID=UPI0018A77777|nr:uncharacterized protein LOC119569110 [Penaeus monodon]
MSDTSQEVDPLRVLQDYQLHLVGLLYNVMVNPYNMKICRVIVPLQLQDTAVQLAHSLPVSGHGGVLATLVRFRSPANKSTHGSCGTLPIFTFFCKNVLMSHKYILTVVDALTKYLYTAPLKSKEASEVARAFISTIVTNEGAPSQVISDGGGEFLNELFETVCKQLGIDKWVITPYHPSSNEQVERVNGVLTKILRTMVVDNPENWSSMLAIATLAYNTAYHRIIRDSLFFALKHRDPQ